MGSLTTIYLRVSMLLSGRCFEVQFFTPLKHFFPKYTALGEGEPAVAALPLTARKVCHLGCLLCGPPASEAKTAPTEKQGTSGLFCTGGGLLGRESPTKMRSTWGRLEKEGAELVCGVPGGTP